MELTHQASPLCRWGFFDVLATSLRRGFCGRLLRQLFRDPLLELSLLTMAFLLTRHHVTNEAQLELRGCQVMPGYRCFLFGDDNHIIRRIEYDAETDALAIVEGRARYAAHAMVLAKFGFEIWQERRFVYSEDRESQGS